jgi:hypothetical protein
MCLWMGTTWRVNLIMLEIGYALRGFEVFLDWRFNVLTGRLGDWCFSVFSYSLLRSEI